MPTISPRPAPSPLPPVTAACQPRGPAQQRGISSTEGTVAGSVPDRSGGWPPSPGSCWRINWTAKWLCPLTTRLEGPAPAVTKLRRNALKACLEIERKRQIIGCCIWEVCSGEQSMTRMFRRNCLLTPVRSVGIGQSYALQFLAAHAREMGTTGEALVDALPARLAQDSGQGINQSSDQRVVGSAGRRTQGF